MKFSTLQDIINQQSNELDEIEAYSGGRDFNKSHELKNKLNDYKQFLIIKYDLRPSEYSKLNDIEVGEPLQFYNEIIKHKVSLARNITLV